MRRVSVRSTSKRPADTPSGFRPIGLPTTASTPTARPARAASPPMTRAAESASSASGRRVGRLEPAGGRRDGPSDETGRPQPCRPIAPSQRGGARRLRRATRVAPAAWSCRARPAVLAQAHHRGRYNEASRCPRRHRSANSPRATRRARPPIVDGHRPLLELRPFAAVGRSSPCPFGCRAPRRAKRCHRMSDNP